MNDAPAVASQMKALWLCGVQESQSSDTFADLNRCVRQRIYRRLNTNTVSWHCVCANDTTANVFNTVCIQALMHFLCNTSVEAILYQTVVFNVNLYFVLPWMWITTILRFVAMTCDSLRRCFEGLLTTSIWMRKWRMWFMQCTKSYGLAKVHMNLFERTPFMLSTVHISN